MRTLTKYIWAILFPVFLIFTSCRPDTSDPVVIIKTDMGSIRVRLYNDTPLHRDNFLKLASSGYYDHLLFHRVIDQFMIQCGDPLSRSAGPDKLLGSGGPGYTIPAEILPSHFHKKGALAAARLGDNQNPERASSGSQFYLVQGKSFSDNELDQIEERIRMTNRNALYQKVLDSLLRENPSVDDPVAEARMQDQAMLETEIQLADSEPYRIPESQRSVYRSLGGTPHLDGSYTVFGEVIDGLDVIDKIATVKTDAHDRPVKDVHIRKIKVCR